MPLTIQLHPPLNNTAGRDWVDLALPEPPTVGGVLQVLVERFGPVFRRHLFDTEERLIPAWCVFINGRPLQLNRPESLAIPVGEGDQLSIILNIAGG
ncbi:MAG: MoaD/ThiS family protein [Chloroflexota bacterium]